jgi:NADH pyrophosphatase NudC (nudix superfamily)
MDQDPSDIEDTEEDDLEDEDDDIGPVVPLTPEEEEAQRREQVATTTMLREFQRGAPVEEGLATEMASVLDEKLEEHDMCPQCGASMEAEQDPDSLLSFPMIFLWTCAACGHNERREDTE